MNGPRIFDRVVMFIALGLALWGVSRANSAVSNIQHQRVTNIRDACLQQNLQNGRVEKGVLALVPKPSAAQRKAVKAFAAAIAPKQDCVKVVRDRT